MGGALTPWDYSTYASGVVDRRQNAIPNYPNGMVLITPVQEGAMARNDVPRGKLVDHLHPIYKNILKEYITDGVNYISADGKDTLRADEYYKQVEQDIKASAKQLPINVRSIDGKQLGWVVAQTSPTHLRLTLVDGGWLNPNNINVEVTFNTVNPIKVQDILSKEKLSVKDNKTTVIVPCGMFRFIDIELDGSFAVTR